MPTIVSAAFNTYIRPTARMGKHSLPRLPSARFVVMGLNHDHVLRQASILLAAGAEFHSFYAPEQDLAVEFAARCVQTRRACSIQQMLEDETVQPIVCAQFRMSEAVPFVMAKNVMLEKSALVTLQELDKARAVQMETSRICSVFFARRFENGATVNVFELARSGSVTTGLGPPRGNRTTRPPWFFQPACQASWCLAQVGIWKNRKVVDIAG
ncbi:hypothetical protein QN224_33000 [Sinorhizobium sp. 8-89]|uniref:hypothetical protein n=1 Tax=Sinorhizobium sp. 7-81 TaxID=3049087 RepID=UPI0024C3C2D0|nr:hypothetical protein [Sinorhizobium sp. 7-81]MDK1390115.1 hypothetical protein [Sinorhizobium sp. 7-81]